MFGSLLGIIYAGPAVTRDWMLGRPEKRDAKIPKIESPAMWTCLESGL
jgi:hypothetical protein